MKLLRKWELLTGIAAVLVIVVFVLAQHFGDESGIAVVSVDGVNVLEIDLGRAEDQLLSLRDEHGIPADLEVADHRIRFVNVTCPDHICEKTGFVSRPGQSAVCMPNRTVITIV